MISDNHEYPIFLCLFVKLGTKTIMINIPWPPCYFVEVPVIVSYTNANNLINNSDHCDTIYIYIYIINNEDHDS